MNESEFTSVLEKIRSAVSEGLDRSSDIMQKVASDAPGSLRHYLGELVAHKGKRMRATFVLLLALAGKKSSLERAALVASAIELLHLATLVHDDIIDESEMRRHRLTAHMQWGPRIAVLVGDYALSKALDLIIDDEDRRLPSSLSRASGQLIAGEIMEIEQSGNMELTVQEYMDVIYGKTASLWETCGKSGALLGGYEDNLIEKCSELGRNMGIAFQIVDDLLDYGFGAHNTGKKENLDLKNGIVTLPIILFFQNSSEENKMAMKTMLHKSGDAFNQEKITQLIMESGSFQNAKKMAHEKINFCINTIKEFPQSKYLDYLIELCEIVGHRSA